MMCITFFFCLHPGDYTGVRNNDQAFSLDDATLFIRTRHLYNKLNKENKLLAATSMQLAFTTQKNRD